MISAPEACVLLSLPGFSLSGPGLNPNTGVLDLESVSVPNPDSTRGEERNVYLVLRLNNFETPIDPMCAVTRMDEPKARIYKFSGTPLNPNEFVLSVNGPFIAGDQLVDELDAFENILEQYVDEFRTTGAGAAAIAPLTAGQANTINGAVKGDKDLRGHLVMINEDTGEIIGQVEDRLKIHEDATMHAKGNEHEPVVINVPDEYTRDSDRHALEVFATVIPPEQRNWISTSANIVSHAISMGTNLLIATINTGASYYVNHSTPSLHNPNASGSTTPTTTTNKGAPGISTQGNAPPLPPRALVFLTSDRTRKNLSSVHALSGQAVKVSNKTVALIDSMIRRAMGAKPKRERYFPTGVPASASGSNPNLLDPKSPSRAGSRSPSPSPSTRLVPPPYPGEKSVVNEKSGYGGYPNGKPALPPRRSPSPASPAYQRSASPSGYNNPSGTVSYQTYQPHHPQQHQQQHQQHPQQQQQQQQQQLHQPQPQRTTPGPPLPSRKLKTKDHILISADLILSTIDDSARRVLDAGTEQLGKVVGHKYGAQAAESSLYMAGTARNVGLVYIDMSGIGRRALLKRAGKTFLKARVSSNDPQPYPMPGQVVSPAPQR